MTGKKFTGIGISVLALISAMPSLAQTVASEPTTTAAPKAEKDDATVVVVTGTLLRGKAPVGSHMISLGQDKVTSSGVTNSNDLLATLPQVSNYFNSVPTASLTTPTASQVSRPNLRNLPGGGYATGSSSLILVDGHRVASVGVTQMAVDPDMIATGVIDRVEIVPDGGSATYGADAVGGVINFITKRRFSGVKLDARYGTADNYSTYDVVATAGKDWGSGSAYLSYSYGHNDSIYGRDRSYVKRYDYSGATPVPTGTQCDSPNITLPGLYLPAYNFTLPGATYALPGLVANTTNRCDVDQNSAFIPEVTRQAAFGGYSQDLSDRVKLDVRAYYSKREIVADGGPLRNTVAVPRTNPYYIAIPSNPTATQQVSFSYGPALGNSTLARSKFEAQGVNATFTVDLNDNWQLRSLFNYSSTNSSYDAPTDNPTLLAQYAAGATADTAINPYNIGATTNKQLLTNLANWEYAGEGTDQLLNQRDIIDGRLFDLPGGEVRLAVGYEYMGDAFTQRYGTTTIGGVETLPRASYKRTVNSVFTELQVPIIGRDNALPGIQSLVLSLAGRYDDYSDFGHTSNPKIGINYKPVKWLELVANAGTSFNAPTLVDQLGSNANSILAVPIAVAVKPGQPAATGSWTVALQGSAPNLKPQTADTWSLGLNIDPPAISGLHFNATYYSIFFKGLLAKPSVADPTGLFANFGSAVTINPTDAQIIALGAQAAGTGGPAQVAPFLNGGRTVYELIDFRTNNFGNSKVSGLDFGLSYTRPTSFGSFDTSFAGNYQLTRKTQVTSAAPFNNDLLYGISRLTYQATGGVNIGQLRAQITWYHRDGYNVKRATSYPQDGIKAFDTLNTFFRYSLRGTGLYSDLDLTLNVSNILDRNPPLLLLTGADGYTNGSTIGRLIMLGISKKF